MNHPVPVFWVLLMSILYSLRHHYILPRLGNNLPTFFTSNSPIGLENSGFKTINEVEGS